MAYRTALVAAVLLLGLAPASGEATTRMSFSVSKSFHPGEDNDYSTTHPGIGATGPLVGEWLRWRAGVVRHSHTRLGPVAGASATWKVSESWRLGLTAGIIGNYRRGHWFRRGVLPIVQWQDRDRDLVWELAFGRNEQVTFIGVNLQVPISVFAAR